MTGKLSAEFGIIISDDGSEVFSESFSDYFNNLMKKFHADLDISRNVIHDQGKEIAFLKRRVDELERQIDLVAKTLKELRDGEEEIF